MRWGFKTIKQIRAECELKAQRSHALFDAYPKMSTQLNSQLTNRLPVLANGQAFA
ncbi:hypothetical protein CMPELA_12595 [Cupriavidus necator]